MADAESVLTALTTLRGMQFVEGGVETIDASFALIRSQAEEIERLKAHVTRLSGCLLVIASAHHANATDLRMTALAASANGRSVKFCQKSLGVTMPMGAPPQDGGAL